MYEEGCSRINQLEEIIRDLKKQQEIFLDRNQSNPTINSNASQHPNYHLFGSTKHSPVLTSSINTQHPLISSAITPHIITQSIRDPMIITPTGRTIRLNAKIDEPVGIYRSSSSASGRTCFLGPRGGVYFLTPTMNKSYLNDSQKLYNVEYFI